MQSLIPFIRRTVGLSLIVMLVSGQAAKAQSTISNQSTKSYDTTLSSDGFGIYHLQFPQFSPDSGTLVSVRISALTNTLYGFTLRNADSVNETYTLTVGLQDQFTGAALPATYSNVSSQSLGNFPLAPGQQVTQAPTSLMEGHTSTDTIRAVGSFEGSGKVNLQYQAFTFTNLNSVNRASYYYNAGISNALTFAVEYVYSKSSSVLPTDLKGWMAEPTGPRNVELSWAASNEISGRQYVIQRSGDQNNFSDIATLAATADGNTAHYTYPDELPENLDNASTGSEWLYRLKIIDQTGQVSYSPIRAVKAVVAGNGVQVYPNPATTYINVVPNGQQVSDWQVDIVAASGQVVQRNVYDQAQMMTVNFQNKLAAGTYFVRATDLRGKNTLMSSFIVP